MIRAWDRFFFEPRTARVLGLYRIVFGVVILYCLALLAKDTTLFFSDSGLVTCLGNDLFLGRQTQTVLRWLRSPWAVRGAMTLLFAVAAMFTIGWHTRLSTVALFLLIASFHERNVPVLYGCDTVIRTMLFAFLFAPSGAAFSVDSLRRRARGEDRAVLVLPWAQRMMQIQVTVIYLIAGGGKLLGERYRDGSAMYYILGRLGYHNFGVEQLMNYPSIYAALTWSMIAIEIPLPFLLWIPRTRPIATLAGILLHGWIIVFMVIPVFGIVMLASYIPFFSELELDSAIAAIRRRFSTRKARIFLDPRLSRMKRLLQAIDLFERVEWGAGGAGEMRLVTPEGREHRDTRALRWLALRCPATFWMAPLLWLPGASFLLRSSRILVGDPAG